MQQQLTETEAKLAAVTAELANNLVLVDNEINLELNRSDLRSEHAEITEVGVAIAALKVATRSRKKRRKQA